VIGFGGRMVRHVVRREAHVIRKPLLAVAALVLGATGVSLAPTAADAADAGPLLRVTARCDGPGSKMMLGIHPSATGGVVAATRITHVRHSTWLGETLIGDQLPDEPDIHLRRAVRHVVTDWVGSSKSWPKPVVATFIAAHGPMCLQAAESTRRADVGAAMDQQFRVIAMQVLPRRGLVDVAAEGRPGSRVRVAVNIRTSAGFQHRVRFVRADRDGLVQVRFRTFEKVDGYTRALARVMTGHGPSQIIQLARVR